MTRSEQDIVRRARAGDERAFEELVTTYEKKIYHISLRYTGNEHDALAAVRQDGGQRRPEHAFNSAHPQQRARESRARASAGEKAVPRFIL